MLRDWTRRLEEGEYQGAAEGDRMQENSLYQERMGGVCRTLGSSCKYKSKLLLGVVG